ncbi:hypothetical protein ACKKBG_A08310 [Auxenochlorella protothecoides x Auxenochlorella symbiontica]
MAPLLTATPSAYSPYPYAFPPLFDRVAREASLDGGLRLLRLSVEDRVQYLDGRKVRQVQRRPRWRDDFRFPGQSVALRFCPGPGAADVDGCAADGSATVRFALASSPTSARNESAGLDATLVELLLDTRARDSAASLAAQEPGTPLEVSQVLGRGFSSVLSLGADLATALEEQRPLLLLGASPGGVAALRSALSWTPLLAHAAQHPVVAVVLAPSPTAAPFVVEWEEWRQAGVKLHSVFEAGGEGGARAVLSPSDGQARLAPELGALLGSGPAGLRALLGPRAREACVLLSGIPPEQGAELAKRLAEAGVHGRSILVADAGAVGLD